LEETCLFKGFCFPHAQMFFDLRVMAILAKPRLA
jgi:hypothetical protein